MFAEAPVLAVTVHMCSPKRVVYLLQSSRDPQQYYVGLTSDPIARLAAHNAGESLHTARWRPWRTVVTTPVTSTNMAYPLAVRVA